MERFAGIMLQNVFHSQLARVTVPTAVAPEIFNNPFPWVGRIASWLDVIDSVRGAFESLTKVHSVSELTFLISQMSLPSAVSVGCDAKSATHGYLAHVRPRTENLLMGCTRELADYSLAQIVRDEGRSPHAAMKPGARSQKSGSASSF
jgi:hypothetical protein